MRRAIFSWLNRKHHGATVTLMLPVNVRLRVSVHPKTHISPKVSIQPQER